MQGIFRNHPKWNKDLRVWFLGGRGKIFDFSPESKTWAYTIEMEMGPEPNFGRIGAETTVILYEEDILGVVC